MVPKQIKTSQGLTFSHSVSYFNLSFSVFQFASACIVGVTHNCLTLSKGKAFRPFLNISIILKYMYDYVRKMDNHTENCVVCDAIQFIMYVREPCQH